MFGKRFALTENERLKGGGGGIAASTRDYLRFGEALLAGYGSITVWMVGTIDAHFERLSSHSA